MKKPNTAAKILQAEQAKKKLDKEVKDVKEQVQPLMIGDYEPDVEEPLLIPGKGGYTINDKVLAVMYLEVIQDIDPKDGEMKPRYTHVERYLGVPEATLRQWWKKRQIIESDGEQFLVTVEHYLKLEVAREIIDTLRVLKGANKTKLVASAAGFKSLADWFNMLIRSSRLLQNRSTANVEHQHTHKGDVALVIPDDD